MKKNVKLFGRIVMLFLAIVACETNNFEEDPILVSDWKLMYNGMIKSYNNEMVLKWDNAIGLAIDNLSPPPSGIKSICNGNIGHTRRIE